MSAVASVLVTGASRGIGRATAEALLACGKRVVAVSTQDADLSVAGEAERLVDEAARKLGGLDGLVCCAGVNRRAGIEGLTREDLAAQMAVNFEAPLFAAQRFAALRRAAGGGGAIVNVASTLGVRPVADAIAYAASKAALIAATRALALDLAPLGIRVNAVAPGLIDTDMIAGRPRDELAALHPLGRLGTPEEVAAGILYLLDAPFVTGMVHAVDGGLLL